MSFAAPKKSRFFGSLLGRFPTVDYALNGSPSTGPACELVVRLREFCDCVGPLERYKSRAGRGRLMLWVGLDRCLSEYSRSRYEQRGAPGKQVRPEEVGPVNGVRRRRVRSKPDRQRRLVMGGGRLRHDDDLAASVALLERAKLQLGSRQMLVSGHRTESGRPVSTPD